MARHIKEFLGKRWVHVESRDGGKEYHRGPDTSLSIYAEHELTSVNLLVGVTRHAEARVSIWGEGKTEEAALKNLEKNMRLVADMLFGT